MSDRRPAALVLALAALLGSCSTNEPVDVTPVDIPAASMAYVVLAWNDLGMHDLNATYAGEVYAPPYNTLRAQVVRRGDPPEVVTSGVTLEYSIVGNTYSYGKATLDPVRSYAGFWDASLDLFGVALAPDTGLNFVDPDVHNGLTGTMLAKDGYFEATGVPVVPIDDAGTWDPYQVAEIVVRDASTGAELVRTRATVPVSDEINCTKCHGQVIDDVEIGSVLAEHDDKEATTFVAEGLPVNCSDCHGSPILGQTGEGTSGKYLSYAIHSFHYTAEATCYDCHPGETTLFHRSTAHTTADGNCDSTDCHGGLSTVSSTIYNGRVPWESEPKCSTCHLFVAEVDTGTVLYRNAVGHGGLSCAACHGSPHAQVPTDNDKDGYQSLQYQSKALSLGSCRVCHASSKGGGLIDVVLAHGGAQPTACNVCHTAGIQTNNPYEFPHRFQQKRR